MTPEQRDVLDAAKELAVGQASMADVIHAARVLIEVENAPIFPAKPVDRYDVQFADGTWRHGLDEVFAVEVYLRDAPLHGGAARIFKVSYTLCGHNTLWAKPREHSS